MNYGIVTKVLGILLILESAGMVPPFLISAFTGGNDFMGFLYSIILTFFIGFAMYKVPNNKKNIRAREALSIVSIGWILISFFGALPFIFSGSIPSMVDAFFEMVSGFTTTGATIIDDIEVLPMGILFWRSFSHWIGGMGIIVFTVAILPALGVGSFQIFKAESPGPTADRIVPRIKDTAKILYVVYIGITILEIILLKLGGMTLYESFIHTFGTVGTGGFSTRNGSIGAFNSSYINIVISIFMVMSGINFSLYYQLFKGKWRDVFKNEELRLYLGIILVSVILITVNIYKSIYSNFGESLQHSFFQVSSIITTTGYGTADFDKWTTFSKSILFMLMFVGGCAGSTGGSIKNIRILVLIKLVKRETYKIFHPRSVVPIKVNERALSTDVVLSIASFFALYMLIFVLGTIVISLEGIGLVSSASSVAATLGNIGPGFGFVGPTHTYSGFSNASKMLFSFFMLFGRLELFTMLVMFNPKFWKAEI
ncbi:MAG: TrkH family potassium uptake protein [Clostridiaceae bacterium]